MLVQVELGETCNDLWSLLIPAEGLGALQVPQWVQGRALAGVQMTKSPGGPGVLQLHSNKNS